LATAMQLREVKMTRINLNGPKPLLIQQGLQELGETDTNDLAEHVDLSVATVAAVLSELYKFRRVHICAWARTKRGVLIRKYAWGDGEDAERPLKTYRSTQSMATEVPLPFPRCDIAASWIRSSV